RLATRQPEPIAPAAEEGPHRAHLPHQHSEGDLQAEEIEALPRGRASQTERDRVTLVRHLGAGIGRLLRLGATTASIGVLGIFAYQGGEHLAGFAGATTPGDAVSGRQVAAIAMPMLPDRPREAPPTS